MPPKNKFAEDWQPTCSIEILRLRATLIQSIRDFFVGKGYLEVETPLLSRDIVIDAHLEPFEVSTTETNDDRLFLQTSPEAAMKRLLASGTGSIFQITHSFRRHESGRRHNPEFTMVEWYGVETTWQDQMMLTEELVRQVHQHVPAESVFEMRSTGLLSLPSVPFQQSTYDATFQRAIGHSVLELDMGRLRNLAQQQLPEQSTDTLDRDELLNLLLAECVEPSLGDDVPEFVYNYPASQAALAEVNADDERTARRFELYWNSIELCNGYQELTDPAELIRRDRVNNRSRIEALPGAERMLAAMQSGLPACSGVALGFDRLLMTLLGFERIEDVIPFPVARA